MQNLVPQFIPINRRIVIINIFLRHTEKNIKDYHFKNKKTFEHKTGIDLTVSSTLKKPSKNYTCFISRHFGLFLIHLQSKNKATLGNVSNSKP